MRDLSGSILYILQRKVDMTQVLKYPVTAVPLYLSHVGGTMLCTPKSAEYILMRILQRDGKVIHFVCGEWITPSVKHCERQSRNATDIGYHIVGAAQAANKLARCSLQF